MKHDYSDIWPVLPLGWWGAATDGDGERFLFEEEPESDGDNFIVGHDCKFVDHKGNGYDWENSAQAIPEREAVLNQLAEIAEWRNVSAGDSCKYDIDFDQWQERRRIRIEAGLIEVKTPSKKQTREEWNGEGLPPAGVECEMRCHNEDGHYGWTSWKPVKIIYCSRVGAVIDDGGHEVYDCEDYELEFRPIQTEEQKIKAEIEVVVRESGGNYDDVDCVVQGLYDAGYRLIKGSKDEN